MAPSGTLPDRSPSLPGFRFDVNLTDATKPACLPPRPLVSFYRRNAIWRRCRPVVLVDPPRDRPGHPLLPVIHIIDTFLVVAYPAEYDFTVDIYGGVFDGIYFWPLRWAFRAAELGLIACVLFHAINGVRIVLFDFWPKSADHQQALLDGHERLRPDHAPGDVCAASHPRRSAGSCTPVESGVEAGGSANGIDDPRINFDTRRHDIGWKVERRWRGISSRRAVSSWRPGSSCGSRACCSSSWPLGHLFITHILNNVENINYEFVANRWADPEDGVIWRLWDLTMINLAVLHGFNGLRQILDEYVIRPGRRVLTHTLIWSARSS